MLDLLLKGLALAGISLEDASKILGVDLEGIKDGYAKLLNASVPEKLEVVFSEPIDNNKKFLKLCFYGKEKFIRHFLGISYMSPKEVIELLMKVETDTQTLARLGKLLLDYEKLEAKKKQTEESANELMDILRTLKDRIDDPSV